MSQATKGYIGNGDGLIFAITLSPFVFALSCTVAWSITVLWYVPYVYSFFGCLITTIAICLKLSDNYKKEQIERYKKLYRDIEESNVRLRKIFS